MTKQWTFFGCAIMLLIFVGNAFGHGLMQDPPSRNWFCGAVTKPHEILWGDPEYPVCGEAFENFDGAAGGYQFMSALTHTEGRSVVTPLPEHVCGFGSETWSGGDTPWDQPIDWPTNSMSAGRQEFTWNIFWGPHFSDTKEFRYWITTPDFEFQVGTPLSWTNFETEPFCVLDYDPNNPNANSDIVPDEAGTLFHTYCDVPVRSGRHVIYGEWGRNHWTFERFHGCVDVQFDGGSPDTVQANIAISPEVSQFTGPGLLQLSGSESIGENLTYLWSVDSSSPALYSLSNPTSVDTILTLSDPTSSSDVTITLVVSSNGQNDSEMVSITHHPSIDSAWNDLGQVGADSQTLNVGDQVQVRVVRDDGTDEYYPSPSLVINGSNTTTDKWVFDIAEAVNSATSNLQIGVLDSNDSIAPSPSAADNRMYAGIQSGIASAFVEIDPATTGSCAVNYDVVNHWGSGFQVNLTITNHGSASINGYELEWSLGDGETFAHGWNATFNNSGSVFSASNPAGHWNGDVAANGGTVTFGFIGQKSSSGDPFVPTAFSLNGTACDTDAGGGG